MVSEGVDIPRLAVGVYATTTSTPLFFAQAVGRFVRARRRGETASVFLPSVLPLLGFAAEMEVQRDHVLGRPVRDDADIFAAEDDLLARSGAGRGQPSPTSPATRRCRARRRSTGCSSTAASSATRGSVAIGSDEEMDFLGIPGLLDADQVKDLLRHRQSERIKEQSRSAPSVVREPSAHEHLSGLRRELNGLVATWHHRSGAPHGVIHAELRRACGGPPAAVATAAELTDRSPSSGSGRPGARRE